VAEPPLPELVASFFTLSGAGFGEPPRNSFTQRCEAAAAAGFAGIGLHVDDLRRNMVAGLEVADMSAVLADTGLRLVEVEFLAGWAVDVDEAALASTLRDVEAVADAFGGRHVSAGEFRGGLGLDLDAAAGRLRAIAGRLGKRGLLLALEPFPWSAIPDVATAVKLLRRAEVANAGLLVDVWHFYNGGGRLDELLSGGVAAVQLNDGPRVDRDYLRHARSARRLPGEGELDVVGLVRAVERTGFSGPYCVEVNTPEFRALPVAEAATRAAAAAASVLRAARPRLPVAD